MDRDTGQLIDRVLDAAGSERNAERIQRRRKTAFGMEEPIVWKHVFPDMDVGRFFEDPRYYLEQTLQQKLWRWEQFPDDDQPIDPAVPSWLGHYPEYTFVGIDVQIDGRGVPIMGRDHPMASKPDVRLLHPVEFGTSGWMPRLLRWHNDLTAIAEGRLGVPFAMKWWRGCLDLAVQLRGYENFVMDIRERPQFVRDLLGYLTEQRCRWHEAWCGHFGSALGPTSIGDDWINAPFITPAMFEDFVLPRYTELEAFHGGVAGVHSCGNQAAPFQKLLLRLRSLASLEVSPWTSLAESLANVPGSIHLHVSLHPNDVLCATSGEMSDRLRTIVAACAGRSFSVGTAGLTPLSDDVAEFVRRIVDWTSAVKVTPELQNNA